jgi:uncharacterized protein involved in exopolysaccharide biosynthesis
VNTAPPENVRRGCGGGLWPHERGWRRAVVAVFAVVFAGVFLSALVSTLTEMRLYQAEATLKMKYPPSSAWTIDATESGSLGLIEDINTSAAIAESAAILKKVAERIESEGLHQAFMAPYPKDAHGGPSLPLDVLGHNRQVVKRKSGTLAFQYRHPDRLIAAKVANFFAEECLAYMAHERTKLDLRSVADIQVRLDAEKIKIEKIGEELKACEAQMAALKQDGGEAEAIQRLSELCDALKRELGAKLQNSELLKKRQVEFETMITAPSNPMVTILDRAVPPAEGDYVSPDIPRELGWGLLRALGWASASALGMVLVRFVFVGRKTAAL